MVEQVDIEKVPKKEAVSLKNLSIEEKVEEKYPQKTWKKASRKGRGFGASSQKKKEEENPKIQMFHQILIII